MIPRIPVDSADAAELRDQVALDDTQHDPDCRDGWLGEDHHDRPIPCLICRPHLRSHRPGSHR